MHLASSKHNLTEASSPPFDAGRKIGVVEKALMWKLLHEDPRCPSRVLLDKVAQAQTPIGPTAAGPRPCLWPWALACAQARTYGVCTAWQTWGFSGPFYSRPGNRVEQRSMSGSCKICVPLPVPKTRPPPAGGLAGA